MPTFSFVVHLDTMSRGRIDDRAFAVAPDDVSVMLSCVDDAVSLDVEVDNAVDEQNAVDRFEEFLAQAAPGVAARYDLELVNVTEIASRLDVNRETVRLWDKSHRGGFPSAYTTTAGMKLWMWAEIYVWAASADRPVVPTYDQVPLSPVMTHTLNARPLVLRALAQVDSFQTAN